MESNHSSVGYEEIPANLLASHEARVAVNQVSPKIFEAIRLRTALVLFDAAYSGVVQPDIHFIPLRKDFANVDEVLANLQDDDYWKAMTERACNDVVVSGKYSFRRFVEGVDADMERQVLHIDSRERLVAHIFADRK